MKSRHLVLPCLIALAAFEAQPHAMAYFFAHLGEIEPTLGGCAAGSIRGKECECAEAALSKLPWRGRMRMYKLNAGQK